MAAVICCPCCFDSNTDGVFLHNHQGPTSTILRSLDEIVTGVPTLTSRVRAYDLFAELVDGLGHQQGSFPGLSLIAGTVQATLVGDASSRVRLRALTVTSAVWDELEILRAGEGAQTAGAGPKTALKALWNLLVDVTTSDPVASVRHSALCVIFDHIKSLRCTSVGIGRSCWRPTLAGDEIFFVLPVDDGYWRQINYVHLPD